MQSLASFYVIEDDWIFDLLAFTSQMLALPSVSADILQPYELQHSESSIVRTKLEYTIRTVSQQQRWDSELRLNVILLAPGSLCITAFQCLRYGEDSECKEKGSRR